MSQKYKGERTMEKAGLSYGEQREGVDRVIKGRRKRKKLKREFYGKLI